MTAPSKSPMEGLSSGTVYEGKPPGNAPGLMPWDASLAFVFLGSERVPFQSPMEGLSNGTVYEGRPPGNAPELVPWD